MLSSSVAELFRSRPVEEREDRLKELSDEELEALVYCWNFWARPEQILPARNANPRTPDGSWFIWMTKAGRGWGKTRVGAETTRIWARDFPIVNLIGATADDARDIMIEGESGILAICPRDERPEYIPSKRKLVWPNGAVSLIFTADEPERLRGKQHMKAWADEVGAWRYAESWDQLMLGLRLGLCPQAVLTTTPRATKLIKEIVLAPTTIVTNGTTYENEANLAPTFLSQIITKYEGTRLGRQELNAEILEDNPNAIFQRDLIEVARVATKPSTLSRVVVGVDPAVTSNEDSDLTGIVVAAVDSSYPPHFYILEDASLSARPETWASKAVVAYHANQADRIVGEVNNGGDLVESVIRVVDVNVSYKAVHASRGKAIRAEPVAALYEQGRIHHVGAFDKLEDQMCDYDPTVGGKSPDRMDALVWAITELMDEQGSAALEYVRRLNASMAEENERDEAEWNR